MKFRSLLSGLAAAASLAAGLTAAPTPEQIAAESARANAFFERAFAESIARHPMTMTQLGMKTDYDKWDDFSEAGGAEDLALVSRQLGELERTINFAALDEQAKVSYRMFVRQSDETIESWRWRYHGYTFDQINGLQSILPAFLISYHTVDNVSDARAYVARLNGMAPAIDQLIGHARESQARGILPPRFVYPVVIEACQGVIKGEPFDNSGKKSALLEDIAGKVAALKDADAATKTQLIGEARSALLAAVKPAFEKIIALEKAQEKVATTDDGVWKLPDGGEYYSYRLRENTTTNLTADEIHELGRREVARIQREMEVIKAKLGFQGDLPAFFKFMREDPKFSYPNTPEGRATYFNGAREIIDQMRARLDEFFGVKPKARLVVKEVEPFRAEGSAAAFYEQPSADGARPGTYYVNTFEMKGLPIWEMETLAHHEAIPGHHMQIAIAQELEGMPRFRKFSPGYNAYVEGWALYAEYFPKEFGFYRDPVQDFGRLADELLRAARLVVDTGIHAKHWTRQQVVDYMRANTPDSERDIDTESSRYVVWPGQACAYKIGMLKILELRALAKKELGPKFDLRAFHDLVLQDGAVPLDILGENVKAWIKQSKG